MKKYLNHFLILISGILFALPARAVCPVCTIAIGAGVGLSRWLGIDDLISGVWIGGLIVSLIIWSLNWLNKKQIRFKFRRVIVAVLFYLIVVLPLYWTGVMGHSLNKFLGMDRLLFGIIFGSLAFFVGVCLHNFLKKNNQGKSFFPLQKVVFPLLFLIITSLIFYLIS